MGAQDAGRYVLEEFFFNLQTISRTHGTDQCQGSSWKLSAVSDISLLISALWRGLESPKGGGKEEGAALGVGYLQKYSNRNRRTSGHVLLTAVVLDR